MSDIQALKAGWDVRWLVAEDLGPAPMRQGRAHLWRCPFHGERRGYSLAVWRDGYRCFGACASHGDALDWLMRYRRLSFRGSLEVLRQSVRPMERVEPVRASRGETLPSEAWQAGAGRVVEVAEEALWSCVGEAALGYLVEERGLRTATIRQARLGYVSGHGSCEIEGMVVPCGITIPWFACDALWAVKVRRVSGAPKYVQVKGGSASGLYGADELDTRPVMLCEGEFDALVVRQEAGELVSAVTLGSAAVGLSDRWQAALVNRPLVLVAYDGDAAGQRGAQRLLGYGGRFRQVEVPGGGDISDFYGQGGDVYEWVAQALRREEGEMKEQADG